MAATTLQGSKIENAFVILSVRFPHFCLKFWIWNSNSLHFTIMAMLNGCGRRCSSQSGQRLTRD